jgi:serpin B
VRLDYDVPELGLVIVLPDDVDGAGTVARRLGANELAELFAALRAGQAKKPAALALPKFKIDFKAGLISPLQRAGIRKAFDEEAADFSGMTGRSPRPGDERIYIGDVVHRAVIDVAEDGTEAAAATAIVARAGAAVERNPPPAPEVFRADHPFLFYLVDDTTGAILFQGRVADPRG